MTANGQQQSTMFPKVLLVVVAPSFLLVTAAVAIAVATGVPASSLLRDPSAVLGGPWYAGVFSNTGGALWFVSSAVAFVALSLDVPDRCRPLLKAGAVTSLILGADDLYLIHETVKNDIGIPSPVTIGIYGLVALGFFYKARRELLASPHLAVLVSALALLATSVILDFAGEAGMPTPPYSAIIEDVVKFVGIAVWAAFFVLEARRSLSMRGMPTAGLFAASSADTSVQDAAPLGS